MHDDEENLVYVACDFLFSARAIVESWCGEVFTLTEWSIQTTTTANDEDGKEEG